MSNIITYPTNPTQGQEFTVGQTKKVWDGEKWVNKSFGNHEARLQGLEVHEASNTNPHNVTKAQVGLSNVDNVSAANLRDRSTHTGTQPLSTISGVGSAASKDVGVSNGVASLDGSGKIPDSESQVSSVSGKKGDVDLNLSDIKVNGGTANNVVKAQLISQGLSGNYGFFEEGFTYSVEGDIGIDADGNSWIYVGAGAPNKVVAAGTVPSAGSGYERVTFNADLFGMKFSQGGSITDLDQLVEDVGGNKWRWTGNLNYTFAAGEDPNTVSGWELYIDSSLRPELAGVGSTVLISGLSATNLINRVSGWKTPSEFGASGDGGDYSTEIQSAFDSGFPILFDKDYTASHVKIQGDNKVINFNGYSLIPPQGAKITTEDYVLDITCRSSNLSLIKVNADFKPYVGAIRWHSVSSAEPSNNNKIYGVSTIYCEHGLVYGNLEGEPVVDAPHSENTIFGFYCRGVKIPFAANQPNGFLTMVAPILDCNPYEWAGVSGYNSTEWGTNSCAFINNTSNCLKILGGELLKTFSQLGVGYKGGNFSLVGVTNECAGVRCEFNGDAYITAEGGGFMAGDSQPVYKTKAGTSGIVIVSGGQCYRGSGVSSYSGVGMIENNGGYSFKFSDCKYTEWRPSKVGDSSADFYDVRFNWDDSGSDKVETLRRKNSTLSAIPKNPENNWNASNAFERVTQEGVVHLSGSFTGGNAGVIAVVSNPPSQQMTFLANSWNGASYGVVRLIINPNGNISIDTAGVEVFLDNVSYM